jgi:predicted anti-sigma-YlaC factor YlaD
MPKNPQIPITALAALGVVLLLTGCSIQQVAVNRLGDALASSGTTFAADDDPELVEAAVPFSLKLMESLLAESPRHRGLLGATAAGFTQYSYAFVQQDAEAAAMDHDESSSAASARARRLYLRARDYGLRGLDVASPGFRILFDSDASAAVELVGRDDVDLLYWTAAAWAAAIGLGKDDPGLVADLPRVSTLIDRALAVDESWNRGSIHAFMITWQLVRPDPAGDPEQLARFHFERAVELSRGNYSGPWVTWAESVCMPRADLDCFEEALRAALAVDPQAEPDLRLANTVMQRRASWLLEHADRWFLPPLADDNLVTEELP